MKLRVLVAFSCREKENSGALRILGDWCTQPRIVYVHGAGGELQSLAEQALGSATAMKSSVLAALKLEFCIWQVQR